MNTWIVKGACIASVLWGLTAAHALTVDEARGIAVGDSDARIEALSKAVAQGDDKTAAYLQALADDVVKTANGQVLVVRDGQGTDPVTGQAVSVPPEAEEVMLNNRLRGEIDTALAALKLFSPDVKVRRQAALALTQRATDDGSSGPLQFRHKQREQRGGDDGARHRCSAAQGIQPVGRHHHAVRAVPVAAPAEVFKLELQAGVAGGQGFQHALAGGNHFLADAVSGDGGDLIGCHAEAWVKKVWKCPCSKAQA